ncbi:MAG: DNA polymerase I [Geminicoccaceae bacterium]|nr:DNA polymerase I [Geminicoccaceae bacterium]
MSTTTRKLILVDGSGYIFRAFFALPPMTRPDGTPVNAVFGFSAMLFKLMQERAGDDMIVVFDAGRVSFRNELYADYKANRTDPPEELVPQFALVRDAGRAFGMPVVETPGLEADDLIASYARAARAEGREVCIVSSDKDLMQLVGDGISMWDPMKSRDIGAAEVVERFGVGPELVADCLALAGDTSDNVPGVPGIGIKTAAQLLVEYGSLEKLLGNAAQIKQPKRRESLLAHADTARLSRRLVALREDAELPIPLADVARREPDPAVLLAFLQENDFKNLVGRIEQVADHAEVMRQETVDAPRYEAMTDLAALDRLIGRAKALGRLAIDTETDSLRIRSANLAGICLCVEEGEGFYLPLGHVDEFGHKVPDQLDLETVLARLRPLLADPAVLKIGHNIKYDCGVLDKYDVRVTPIDDTMLLSYVLDGASHGHGMDELAERHLQHHAISYESVCGKGAKQIPFTQAPIDRCAIYAAEDAEVTLRLWKLFRRRLTEEHMATLYETVERPLVPIIAAMELAGIAVDRSVLQNLSSVFGQKMVALEEEAIKLVGHTFNIGSPKQLGEVLHGEMGIGGGKKTKTGSYATGADVLEELALQGHALPRVVLDWRQLQKLTRTYTEALTEEIDASTGRIHTSYAMASTSTGRLSSTEPNLQNIPIRTEEGRRIRTAFVAEPGNVLVSADYSQIELRVLAHMADIGALKEAFARDTDIHAVTAAKMFKRPVEEVGSDLRRSAKMINYGIIYGIGAFGLGQRLGIPQKEAKAFIDAYFDEYPGVRDYMESTKAKAREQGFVTTLFGRRCHVPEINAKLPARRSYAERQAINAPIQGSAADIMKRAMIRVDRALERQELASRMLLQVHDELVLEVPEGEIESVTLLLRDTMAAAAELTVPLVVDVGFGPNWDAAH